MSSLFEWENEAQVMSLTLEFVQAPPVFSLTAFWSGEDNCWSVVFSFKCCQIIQAREMMDIPFSEIQKIMKVTGKAKRWDMIPSGYEKFGSLLENLTINTEQEVLPKSRLESDWKELDRIKQLYGIK